jgi:hypothetical protein
VIVRIILSGTRRKYLKYDSDSTYTRSLDVGLHSLSNNTTLFLQPRHHSLVLPQSIFKILFRLLNGIPPLLILRIHLQKIPHIAVAHFKIPMLAPQLALTGRPVKFVLEFKQRRLHFLVRCIAPYCADEFKLFQCPGTLVLP